MYYRLRIPEIDDPQIIRIFRKYFPLEKVSQKITDDVDILVVLNDNKELIGFISYELRKDTFFVFTLAFDSGYVGKGLASESYPLLVSYVKGLGCQKICGIARSEERRGG